jgi:hypothetical protein
MRGMPILHQVDTRSGKTTSDHTNHMAFFHLGAGSGRSLQKAKGGFTHLFVVVDKFTKG